jgi:hypothetical protein
MVLAEHQEEYEKEQDSENEDRQLLPAKTCKQFKIHGFPDAGLIQGRRRVQVISDLLKALQLEMNQGDSAACRIRRTRC